MSLATWLVSIDGLFSMSIDRRLGRESMEARGAGGARPPGGAIGVCW